MKRIASVALIVILLLIGSTSLVTAESQQPLPDPPPRLYFPDRGQAIAGRFAGYWLEHHGSDSLGYPIGEAIQLDGKLTQWFEYGRLEWDPATGEIHEPPIGRVTADDAGYDRWLSAFRPVDRESATGRYFSSTHHALDERFRETYERDAMSDRLGAPISEPFRIGELTYQFFERGALTWHEARGVQLARLGRIDAQLHDISMVRTEPNEGDIVWGTPEVMQFAAQMSGERWIEVDLSRTLAMAHVGDVMLAASPVVIGPEQSPTPSGDFEIYIRHEVQDLNGIGWNGVPYSAPDTPWVMYFYQDFGFHGSTWRYKFGWAAGQGCIVSPMRFAEQIWKFADYGTRVVVHE